LAASKSHCFSASEPFFRLGPHQFGRIIINLSQIWHDVGQECAYQSWPPFETHFFQMDASKWILLTNTPLAK
jgi:hypothetical protein